MFRGEAYQAPCAGYGMNVNPSMFAQGVASAAPILDGPDDMPYNADIFIAYTRHIIEQMGGAGPRIDDCAREIYEEWAACQHFELYDDVPEVLRELSSQGLRIGLISNTHRWLASFQTHFALQGLISATVSSSQHGFLKPHPSIFRAALQLLDVEPAEGVMVGDRVRQDVEGAVRAGMRAVLLHRGNSAPPALANELGAPVLRTLRELPKLVIAS